MAKNAIAAILVVTTLLAVLAISNFATFASTGSTGKTHLPSGAIVKKSTKNVKRNIPGVVGGYYWISVVTFGVSWSGGLESFVIQQQWTWSNGQILGFSCPAIGASAGGTWHVTSSYSSCPQWLAPNTLASSTGGAFYDETICLPAIGCYVDNSNSIGLVVDFNGNGQAWV